MQILIGLYAEDKKDAFTSAKEKKMITSARLYGLLARLERDGYTIHSLFGSFVFDNATKEVIDIGEAGDNLPASHDLANSILHMGGKMAVIFTKDKYIAFSDRYFLAMHFSNMRRVRPLSIRSILLNYVKLIRSEPIEFLKLLYERQYFDTFGSNHD